MPFTTSHITKLALGAVAAGALIPAGAQAAAPSVATCSLTFGHAASAATAQCYGTLAGQPLANRKARIRVEQLPGGKAFLLRGNVPAVLGTIAIEGRIDATGSASLYAGRINARHHGMFDSVSEDERIDVTAVRAGRRIVITAGVRSPLSIGPKTRII